MAMTKRFKVSFDITIKATTDMVEGFTDELIHLSKKVSLGEEVEPLEKQVVYIAAEKGVEEAISFSVKQYIRERVREEFTEKEAKVSPAFVREIK